MRAGVDVVYQAALIGDGWRGVADFLIRVETPSTLGAWSYEALDTKLARHAKPAYVLQLCFYSERLAALQGVAPERIHVLLGNQTRSRSGRRSSPPTSGASSGGSRASSPIRRRPSRSRSTGAGSASSSHCATRTGTRSTTSAGSPGSSGGRSSGSRRRTSPRSPRSARADDEARPAGHGRRDVREAPWPGSRCSSVARERGRDEYELLPLQAAAGFALLPDPSPGDLFFDFEGNPFWDHEGSLEYLWGQTDANDEFAVRWATDHDGERAAFEAFVDEVHARLAEHPDLHVYHYAQYEITALRRMMGRYGTREAELDDLLRREVFVDLYKVVKGGLRISRPGYGLKEVEHLIGFERTAEIREGGTSIVEFERWMVERDDAILAAIAAYNREDCIATRVLRDWLLERRAEALARFGPFPAPEPLESKPVKPEKEARRVAARGAARQRRPAPGARGAAPRLPRPRAQAVLVGLLRPARPHRGGARRGRGGDRRARPARRAAAGEEVDRLRVHVPAAAAEARRLSGRPGDGQARGRGRRPRLRCAHARAEARPRARRGAAPGGADPGRRLLDEGAGGGAGAVRPLAARRVAGRYPVLESMLRRDGFGRDVQTTDVDELAELLLAIGRGDATLAPSGGPSQGIS